MMQNETRRVVVRFLKAYLSLGAMMVFVVMVSIAKGSDWKILLVGMPLFLIFFSGITYQLVKELRALRHQSVAEKKEH